MTAITTFANIKAKLDIDSTETKWDSMLTSMIAGAQSFVERFTDRDLDEASATYTEYFNSEPIILKNPATSITTLKIWDGSAYDLVDASEYRLLSDNSVEYSFAEGLDKVEVVYVGSGDQPEDLRELVERIVMRQFRKMEHEGEGSTAFEASTTSWSDVIDDFDKDVLGMHRQTWI